MTLEQVIETLTNAGFIVDAVFPYVIVSLEREVSTMEVRCALDWAKLDYSRYGDCVYIRF